MMKRVIILFLMLGVITTHSNTARAIIIWDWSFDTTEAGQFITTGDLVEGTAASGTYELLDFSVSSTALGSNYIGNLSDGTWDYFEADPPYEIVWDGTAVSEWRNSGPVTNPEWVFQNGTAPGLKRYYFGVNIRTFNDTADIGAAIDSTFATLLAAEVAPPSPPGYYVAEGTVNVSPSGAAPVDCTLPMGHLDYCRDCGPCAEGEGDCDVDSECETGLTCKQVTGTDTCQSSSPVCPHPVGHLDYCRDCGPCAEGEGDCDYDNECEVGLTCVQVSGTDTCHSSGCPNPVGHLDFCRDCGPCAAGQGDCDNDSECEAGLICVQVSGTDYCQSSPCPPVGHLDYCSTPGCGPCGPGEGDCDNDSECQSGLTCVQVIGTDVCCSHPIGHLDYCRDCGPCAAGQGDCDNDGECQSGLTCVQVPGTDTCQ